MALHAPVWVALWAVGGLAMLGVAGYAYRDWDRPVGVSFSVLVYGTGLVSLCLLGTYVVGRPSQGFGNLLDFSSILPIVVGYFWTLFGLDYIGRDEFVKPQYLATYLLPSAFFLAHLYLPESSSLYLPVFFVLFLTVYLALALVVVFDVLVIRAGYVEDYLEVGNGLSLAVGSTALPFVSLVSFFVAETSVVLLVPAYAGSTAISAVAFALAVTRYDILETVPATSNVSPDKVVREMDEMVVVVGDEDEIIELNPEAERVVNTEEASVVGRSLTDLFGYTLDEMQSRTVVEYQTQEGRRQYRPSVSPLSDSNGRSMGYAVVLTDVTVEKRREQRLEVMNRVLRHNLRNDMNGVLAYAELISDGHSDPEAMAERIQDGASDVVDIGEKAREIEELMAVEQDASRTVDLATIVENVVDHLEREYEDWEVTVDVPPSLTLHADSRILEPVVRNLVENAVEHNDTDRPRVVVRADRRGGDETVTLTVADDGPGIPDYERKAVSVAEETPLEHGSGLGLWAVKWGVARLGGSVEFGESDLDGTLVTVTLPESPDLTGTVPGLDEGVAD